MQWHQFVWLAIAVVALGAQVARQVWSCSAAARFGGPALPVVLAAVLVMWTAFFSPAHAQVPPEAARYRAELTRAAHSQWGLGAPVAVLAAQVHQESAWKPQAVSRVGARGLAQFMPGTSAWWCARTGTQAADCLPNNPTWALRALVGYDKYLWDRTPERFAAHDRMWVTLRGYNGGLGHWQAEARVAQAGSPHPRPLPEGEGVNPTRRAIDAACGRARRHISHCAENLGYPHRIMNVLQPRYASWGGGL